MSKNDGNMIRCCVVIYSERSFVYPHLHRVSSPTAPFNEDSDRVIPGCDYEHSRSMYHSMSGLGVSSHNYA